MKASAFRRWPVAGAYSPEQTTRLTGGSDFVLVKMEQGRDSFALWTLSKLTKKDRKNFY